VQKNLKTPKTNGVPTLKQNYPRWNTNRFSRRRKNYVGFSDYRSKKKSDYMILTSRSKMLDSGFF